MNKQTTEEAAKRIQYDMLLAFIKITTTHKRLLCGDISINDSTTLAEHEDSPVGEEDRAD